MNKDNAVISPVVAKEEKLLSLASSSIEYNQLPAKYRRISISQTEMEYINVTVISFFQL